MRGSGDDRETEPVYTPVNKLTWKSWEGSISDFYRSCFYRESLLQIIVHLIKLSVPPVDIVDAAIFTENLQNIQLQIEGGREHTHKKMIKHIHVLMYIVEGFKMTIAMIYTTCTVKRCKYDTIYSMVNF